MEFLLLPTKQNQTKKLNILVFNLLIKLWCCRTGKIVYVIVFFVHFITCVMVLNLSSNSNKKTANKLLTGSPMPSL